MTVYLDDAWLKSIGYEEREGHAVRVTPNHAHGMVMEDATPEETFLAAILKLAKAHGWLAYHTRDSRRSVAGFPDLVLTDGTSVLMIELKTNTGKPTVEQARWVSLLAHTGKVEAGIWRPRDWEQISARLTRKERAAL